MDKQLLVQVERLRGKMVAAAAVKQNMLHHDVLILSQSLDELILRVQMEKIATAKVKKTL